MTDLSATPTQQLARIAEIEKNLLFLLEDGAYYAKVKWLCALARKGVEAQQAADFKRDNDLFHELIPPTAQTP